MSKVKYIMLDNGDFAVFSERGGISHSEVASQMNAGLPVRHAVTGGGFVTLGRDNVPVKVFGESVSSKVESSKADAKSITQSITDGKSFQVYVSARVLLPCDIWLLTNSEHLFLALTNQVVSKAKASASAIKREIITLPYLFKDDIIQRYHIPPLW